MKKILLVDNYKTRLEHFTTEYANTYDDILVATETLEKDSNGAYFQLKESALLLLHKNYFENGLIVTDKIVESAKVNEIICFLFSGEEGEVIPVEAMYKNLPIFLNNYKKTEKIIEEILRYGKLYFLEEPLKIREEIFKELFEQKSDDPLELNNNLLNKIKKITSAIKISR